MSEESPQRTAAEALREAAFEMPAGLSKKGFYRWLRDRADRIEDGS